MVAAMAKSNLQRQQQSATTPFMTEPLLSDSGYLAHRKVAQEVLNRTYTLTPNSLKYVVEFLPTLVRPESIRKLGPVNLSISHRDNSTGWPK